MPRLDPDTTAIVRFEAGLIPRDTERDLLGAGQSRCRTTCDFFRPVTRNSITLARLITPRVRVTR